jgi:HTH-type transcriptional regulator/antitoxin HipB
VKVGTPSDLGNLVREARLAAGLTQEQLAQRAGASRLWINQVESGHQGASVGKVLKLLAALDLAMEVAPEQRRVSRLDSVRRRRAEQHPPVPGDS